MPFLNDRVFDLGLNVLDTEANRLDICSAEPTTYTQATSTLSLGNASGGGYPGVAAPADGTPNGRKVVLNAVVTGNITATGTATHWALTDTVNSRLLATGPMTSQAVTSGGTFTTAATDIARIPDA
jgi:hypothetical protein